MKRFKSVLCALSASAILSLVFTGCGEKGEEPVKVEQPAKSEKSVLEHPQQTEQSTGTEQPASEHPE